MAVTALPRTRARPALQAARLPAGLLLAALIAPALDLLVVVEPGVAFPTVALLGASVSGLVLAVSWLRYPRTSWLAAAALAAWASVAMRLVGADVAPVLSLLALLALGTGGAFAPRAVLSTEY